MRTLGGRPERHSEVRTSSFSGSVYNYIDVFLDNTGDPNTAAAVNQTETHEKHQEASQPIPCPGAASALPMSLLTALLPTPRAQPALDGQARLSSWPLPHFSAPTPFPCLPMQVKEPI